MEEKQLMKISKARFGFGGYQEAQFGYWLEFSSKGSVVSTGKGFWSMVPSENAQWTVKNQKDSFGDICYDLIKIMLQAKVEDFADLVGIPVEVTFEGNLLKSWRVLEEVL